MISGNDNGGISSHGISIRSGSNTVVGNIIGPQADGSSYVVSNGQYYGIYILSASNTIVGNIISANESRGIFIIGGGATGNIIKGNYIGLASDLTEVEGAAQDYGIYVLVSANNNFIGGIRRSQYHCF